MRRGLRGRAPWILALTSGVLLTAAGCAQPATLTPSPGSGEPASPVKLSGLKVPAAKRTGLSVWFGNQPVPFTFDDAGTILTIVPMYMSSPTSWPSPPSKPQTIEVWQNGGVIARSAKPFQVLPLKKAPGTSAKVIKAMDDIADAFDSAVARFPPPTPEGQASAATYSDLLHGFGSTGDNSLQSILDGTATLMQGQTVNVDLLDAVLASSGEAKYFETAAQGLSGLVALTFIPRGKCAGDGGADFTLACEMQYQAWEKDYADQVIGATVRNGWYKGASAVFGLVSIVFEPAGIPFALMTIENFIANKIAPALYPSKFQRFHVDLQSPQLPPYDVTKASFHITAENEPIEVTASDLVEVILAALDLKGLTEAKEAAKGGEAGLSLEEQLAKDSKAADETFKKAVKWAIDRYASLLGTYTEKYGATSMNPNVLSVPHMTWGPVEIRPTTTQLLILKEGDSSLVSSTESVGRLDWESIAVGTTHVWAETRGPGPTATVYEPHSVFGWLDGTNHYGAFGNAVGASNHATVKIVNGKVDYSVGNHGSHDAVGTTDSGGTGTTGGGAGSVAASGPNQVVAAMGNGWWALGSEDANGSVFNVVCQNQTFTAIGATIILDSQNCVADWIDDIDAPVYGGGTTSGDLSFDSCHVLTTYKGEPETVLFTASYGGMFEVVNATNGKKESDDFTGKFSAVFRVGVIPQTDAPTIAAIEKQCDGWPPKP